MKNFLNINQRLHNLALPIWLWYLLIIGICAFLLGTKIFLFPPSYINPDPYGYIAIANYYLYLPFSDLRDAFTVGPVIPGLFFLIKKLSFSFFGDSFSDVKFLKFFAFIIYLFIWLLAYKFQKSQLGNLKSLLFVCLFFGFMKIHPDTLSFNAELFGVFLILLIMTIGKINSQDYLKTFFISFISVIALYTKVQLIPLVFLAALSATKIRFERIRVIIFFIFIFLIAELFLYSNGIGFLKSINPLLSYIIVGFSPVSIESPEFSFVLQNEINHLVWCVTNLFLFFPIVGFIVTSLLLNKPKIKNDFSSNWLIWLFVTVSTVFIPHKHFEHYLILVIPFCVKFFPDSFSSVNFGKNLRMKYFIFLCVIFIAVSNTIDAYRNLREIDSIKTRELLNIPATKELDEVKRILQNAPSNLFIHGWDYRINSFLNLPYNGFLLEKFILHQINAVDFINTLSHYDYIMDIVNYSGLIRDKKLSLASEDNMWSYIIDRDYNLMYSENGLSLYKKKNSGSINAKLNQRKADDSWKLSYSLNSCRSCFPLVPEIQGSISNPRAIGTYSNDGDSATGLFKINYHPKTPLNEVKFIVGPSALHLNVVTKTFCKDHKQIIRNISLKEIPAHQESSFFINNLVCNVEHMEITFIDNGKSFGQWLGFLGLYKY